MELKPDSQKIRDFALSFIRLAKEDLETAEHLLEEGRNSNSVYHSQQCIEKAIKSLLEMENFFVGEHELEKYFFLKIISKYKNDSLWKKYPLQEMLAGMEWFKDKWWDTRYPKKEGNRIVSPLEAYTSSIAEEALAKSQFVFEITCKILKERYNLKI